ncbi:hypothetical protein [Caldalkalibacillus salinus]|uniref:hypothetical protein n=1 Tax=Caldalkalibacillus salinus TaxID=2803787 RepID=UPI001920F7D0|nr:hypothetical protein [Caldalkalibacillus salinus]
MFLTYLFYRQGIRQLFKSRIFDSQKSDHLAYALFMFAGLMLGTLSSLAILHLIEVHIAVLWKVVIASLTSILLGEWMYHRNRHLVHRAVDPQEDQHSE